MTTIQLLVCLSVLTVILLIALLYSVRKLSGQSGGKKEGRTVAAVPNFSAPGGVTPEVAAAITAAIASVWEGQNGFVVRHIRRIHNAPAWNRAGREEQIYNRF